MQIEIGKWTLLRKHDGYVRSGKSPRMVIAKRDVYLPINLN